MKRKYTKKGKLDMRLKENRISGTKPQGKRMGFYNDVKLVLRGNLLKPSKYADSWVAVEILGDKILIDSDLGLSNHVLIRLNNGEIREVSHRRVYEN